MIEEKNQISIDLGLFSHFAVSLFSLWGLVFPAKVNRVKNNEKGISS